MAFNCGHADPPTEVVKVVNAVEINPATPKLLKAYYFPGVGEFWMVRHVSRTLPLGGDESGPGVRPMTPRTLSTRRCWEIW